MGLNRIKTEVHNGKEYNYIIGEDGEKYWQWPEDSRIYRDMFASLDEDYKEGKYRLVEKIGNNIHLFAEVS